MDAQEDANDPGDPNERDLQRIYQELRRQLSDPKRQKGADSAINGATPTLAPFITDLSRRIAHQATQDPGRDSDPGQPDPPGGSTGDIPGV